MNCRAPLAFALLALASAACSDNRVAPGGGGNTNNRPKDQGINTTDPDGGTTTIDTGTNNNPGGDSGMNNTGVDSGVPMGCGANPNGCSEHQLIGPSPGCACLNACEPGYLFDQNMQRCVEDVNFDAGPSADAGSPGRDAGMQNRDTGVVLPDTGPRDGGVLATDPFDPMARATEIATAVCAFQTRCEPAFYAYLGNDEAACRRDQIEVYLSGYNAIQQALPSRRVSFNAQAFSRCTAAFGTADCVLGLNDNDCTGIFTGVQPAGFPCNLGNECADGLYCTADFAMCGECAPRAASGADCLATQGACVTGNRCRAIGQAPNTRYLCIPNRVAETQPCGTIPTGTCRGRLQCVGVMVNQQTMMVTPGSCQRPRGPGQACDPELDTAPDCNIFQNQGCNVPQGQMTGTCGMVTFNPPMGACGTGVAQCNSQGECDDNTMRCIAYPGVGQQCSMGACADGLYCEGATCATLKQMGATCMESNECTGQLLCINGQCAPLSFTQCN